MSAELTPVRPGLRLGPWPERHPEPVTSRLEAWLGGHARARRKGCRSFRAFKPTLEQIRARQAVIAQGDDLERLRQRRALQHMLAVAPIVRQHAIDVFAHVAHECRGVLHKELYDEQLYAGWQMLHGALVEMRTGEGKTLAATLPAIAMALAGSPVHMITANDYLAARDTRNLATLYRRFGLSTSSVVADQTTDERRSAYLCDVVYCAHKQIVFDYLRDVRAAGPHRQGLANCLHDLLAQPVHRPLLRGLCFAIVDEADSVLIDDARTPLVLSEAMEGDTSLRSRAVVALTLARTLREDVDYRSVAGEHAIQLSRSGLEALRNQSRHLKGIWRFEHYRQELVRQALTALHLYDRDKHYLVQDGKVILIDESTGRPIADRKLNQGLHQMLEIKERCQVTAQPDVVASISFQQFFARYHRLAGMSGTLREARGELRTVYGLPLVRVPTHRACRLDRMPTRYLPDRQAHLACLHERVLSHQRTERPVLIGTRSLALSQHISDMLDAAGLEHRLLNARQDAEEASIIAEAGQPGAITVATHMAGRGADIPLHLRSRAAGGLHVISVELNDSPRIDRQLFGRAARQGDPGSCESIYCLDDESFKNAIARPISGLLKNVCSIEKKRWKMLLPLFFWCARARISSRYRYQRMELFYTREDEFRQLALAGR